jgi:translation elongation factor EF-Ts
MDSNSIGVTKTERYETMNGRIEAYIHSDTITDNKGGALVKVTSDTDFAANTPEFVAFARLVAKRAFGATAIVWQDVINMFPEMETERNKLASILKETVTVEEICVFRL